MNLDYLLPTVSSRNNQGVLLVEEEEAVTVDWTLNSNQFLHCDYLKSNIFKVDNTILNFRIYKEHYDGNFSFKIEGSVLNFSVRLSLMTTTGDVVRGLFHNLFYLITNEIVMEFDKLCRCIGDNELVKLVATFFPEKEASIHMWNSPFMRYQHASSVREVPIVTRKRQDDKALQMSKELKKKRHPGITAVWTVDLVESLNCNSYLRLMPFDHNYQDYESLPFDLGEDSFQLQMRTYKGIIFLRLRRVRRMTNSALISFRLMVRTIDHQILMHSFLENFDFKVNESHECSFMDRTTYGTTLSSYLATNKQLRIVCTLFREDKNCLNLENASAIHGKQGVLRDLEKLFLSKQNSDLTIEVENEKFEVHRSILSARCPFFANMLQHNMVEKITGVVKIPHYTANVFKDFLLYLYTGQINSFTTEKALSLYCAADEYDASDLKADCLSFMKINLSIETVCDVIALSRKYDEKELLEKAKQFFAQNPLDIIKTEGWKEFLVEHFDEANQMYIMAMEALSPQVKRRKL